MTPERILPMMPECGTQIVVSRLGEHKIALRLPVVERVVRAVSVTQVADAPDDVAGLINVQGSVIPVLDLRGVFGIERRALVPSDLFVIAGAGTRRLALAVEDVLGVSELPAGADVAAGEILPGLGAFIEGAVKQDDGMILIYDLERFLCENGEFLFEQVI